MGVQIAELAGGLLQLALWGSVIFFAIEGAWWLYAKATGREY